jgi:hypothetical protein
MHEIPGDSALMTSAFANFDDLVHRRATMPGDSAAFTAGAVYNRREPLQQNNNAANLCRENWRAAIWGRILPGLTVTTFP